MRTLRLLLLIFGATTAAAQPRLFVGATAGPLRMTRDQLAARPDPARWRDDLLHDAFRWLKHRDAAAAGRVITALERPGSTHYQALARWLPFHAICYDWTRDAPGWTPARRIRAREALMTGVRACEPLYAGPERQVFHNSYPGNGPPAALAAMVLSDELPEARTRWLAAHQRITTELFGAFAHRQGAIQEGYSYAMAFYQPLLLYLAAFTSWTGRDLFAQIRARHGDFVQQGLYWMLYGARGDGTFVRHGDIVTGSRASTREERCWMFDLGAAAYANADFARFAADLRRRWKGMTHGATHNAVWSCLWARDDLAASPSATPLPLQRVWGQRTIGHAILRAGFGPEDLVVDLHAGDHFGFHQHHDQGHFAIWRGEPLAVDGGSYELDEPYYTRYFASAWAHNLIAFAGSKRPDDGGQRRLHLKQCPSVAQHARQRANETGSLRWLTAGEGWSAVACDVTAAYDRRLVRRFVRQVVVCHPDTVIVLDELVPGPLGGRPQWLLQLVGRPEAAGDRVTSTHGDWRLTVQRLLPLSARQTAVEGFHDGQRRHDVKGGGEYWEGHRWRHVVEPASRARQTFLHVLTAARSDATAPTATLVRSAGRLGVHVGRWRVGLSSAGRKPVVEASGD